MTYSISYQEYRRYRIGSAIDGSGDNHIKVGDEQCIRLTIYGKKEFPHHRTRAKNLINQSVPSGNFVVITSMVGRQG